MSKTATKTSARKTSTAKKTVAKKTAKKAAANARHPILDTFTIKVVKKENPFTGAVQVKHADAVLKCNGKTVADAKKAGADSWTVRELVNRGIIAVAKAA
jgi:hypothetical protein